jgi:hypothetical protein
MELRKHKPNKKPRKSDVKQNNQRELNKEFPLMPLKQKTAEAQQEIPEA